jgi:hypothetical protein
MAPLEIIGCHRTEWETVKPSRNKSMGRVEARVRIEFNAVTFNQCNVLASLFAKCMLALGCNVQHLTLDAHS